MTSKPKILRILNRFNLGGPVYNASYLTKYLEQDFETLLVGGQKLEEEESALYIPQSMGIDPVVIPEMTRSVGLVNELKAYKKIKNIIQEFKPDIVHTHASKAGAIGRLAASNMGVKCIVHTFHGHVFEHYFGNFKSMFVKSAEQYLARKSNAIIAISEKQKFDLVDRFHIAKADKVHVIPLGFQLNKFKEDKESKRTAFRSTYNLKDSDVAIGIIGRLAPIKNHSLFLKVFAELNKENKNLKAFVIGDGDLKQVLKEEAKSLGLQLQGENQNIHFTSWINNISDVLPGFEIIALSSLNEGTPVSLIEAQAASIPVISSDVGGVRDVVSKDAGLLFKSEDEFSFKTQLIKLIEDKDMRLNMGKKGEEFSFENFTAKRLANDTKKIYLELLKHSSE